MNDKNDDRGKIHISEEVKELVITRIEAQMSPNLKLSIGERGSLDMEEMIKHVKEGDKIGRQIIDSHLRFIQAQASGALVTALNSV